MVVPAVVPSFDLTPWTGWTMVGEADLFVLLTVGVLALRDPRSLADLWPKGLAKGILIGCVGVFLVAGCIGLSSTYGYLGHSDLGYMRPDNALRAGKGFVTALILMPFLRHRMRTRDDAMGLFSTGILIGLALVGAETFVERAVFDRAFDFGEYAASGPFSAMHVGGDHLGAYVAVALPFAFARRDYGRGAGRAVLRILNVGLGYLLVAAFSIVTCGAAAISAVLMACGRMRRRIDPHSRSGAGDGRTAFWFLLRTSYVFAVFFGLVSFLQGSEVIQQCEAAVAAALAQSEHGAPRRIESRDADFGTALLGMGLGAYPRVTAREEDDHSDFSVMREGKGRFLSLTTSDAFFFGQKVPVIPGANYELSLSVRASDSQSRLVAVLCEKFLLTSHHCAGHEFKPSAAGEWGQMVVSLSTAGMRSDADFWRLRRPIDLAFHTVPGNQPVDIKDVRLIGPDGRQLVANGDFADGVDRWFFSDDDAGRWQIMNQYRMTEFESGLLGLTAFLVLAGAALTGAWWAMRGGDRAGAAIVASLGAFLFLCFFESPLQSPAISTIFHLICVSGLMLLERGSYRAYLSRFAPAWRTARLAGRPPRWRQQGIAN